MTTAEALATLSGFVEELDLGEERAALAHIEKRIEELERLNSELTLGQEYMEKWSDRGDFLCYRHEWLDLEARAEAAEARVKELEKERDEYLSQRNLDYKRFSEAKQALIAAALALKEQAWDDPSEDLEDKP
jgi:DNA repair exonuclease SbcCD ATPase subunit